MPRATPLYFFLILLSLAFLASQLLMSLLLYTDDLIRQIDIFRSLTAQPDLQPDACEKGDCNEPKSRHLHHHDDSNRACRRGHFQLNQDGICHPMLTCKDFEDLTIIKQIGGGAVKQVFLMEWKGYKTVMSNLTHPSLNEDFLHGAEMLQQFQASNLVVQLLGFCPSIPAILTEYHSLGSLENINKILQRKEQDNLVTRFRLCLDYVRIVNFLHTSPSGTRVMCDSNDLPKTLSQFLVTSDLFLVINDLDALPLADSSKGIFITCGKREIVGDFVAPEQLWPYPGSEFDGTLMPGYDEKTDIWKIPAVVDYLLGDDIHGDVVRFNLFKLHSRCRSRDPELRPSAAQVLEGYLEVKQTLKL